MDGFQWTEFIQRFPELAEGIFEGLDDQSLTSCRLVEKSWKNLIDGRNYPWERIVKKSDLEDGNTYLHLAAKYGQTEMFEKIFHKEIEKNPENKDEKTPFHVACEKGHFRIAEFIMKSCIENNIDLNAKDFRGKTGYHYVCDSGEAEMVELLIKNSVECNIDLNTKDNGGQTGYHYACDSGHVKIVELLIKNSVDYNIDLNTKDDNGSTGYALSSGQVKKLILDNYLNPNRKKSTRGATGTARTPWQDKATIIRWRAAADAAHLSANLPGMTPFYTACDNGNVRIAELIMKSSIENNIDFNFYSGFIYACQCGHVKIVELLIKKSVEFNIDLNIKNHNGFSGYALSSGQVKKLILDNSAQFNIDLN